MEGWGRGGNGGMRMDGKKRAIGRGREGERRRVGVSKGEMEKISRTEESEKHITRPTVVIGV